jgi:hypothetical protein
MLRNEMADQPDDQPPVNGARVSNALDGGAPLIDLGPDKMDRIVEIAREHDPDLAVVMILHGTPTRGLVSSMWTVIEGPDAEAQTLQVVAGAVTQISERLLAGAPDSQSDPMGDILADEGGLNPERRDPDGHRHDGQRCECGRTH